ncbi:MAG: hypothetical protein KatS3mg051_2272 [Anaerolineae bacterium]|jgi:hypothetical protein|nr:MAG: hypothetical protein KatS3mg051_2272 [Anaerolineae bacterium]
MTNQERLLNCQALFQVETCRKFCQEVRDRYSFLFKDKGGVVVDWFESPRHECELIVRIRNGVLFKFEGSVLFLKLPFKGREGSTEWETPTSIINYINKRAPEISLEEGELTPELERAKLEKIIMFYESDDFERFEKEYDAWRVWYDKELSQAIERWRATQRSKP